jgi:peptidoglycan/LPS O-acetylase OafA/YrhL
MTGIAIAYRQYFAVTKQDSGYLTNYLNQMPAFLDLFAVGMFTAYLLVWLRNCQNMKRYRLIFTGIMLLGLAGFVALLQNVGTVAGLPNGMINWQASYRPLIAIALMLTAIGSHFANRSIQKLLNNSLLSFFSIISYNLYIWHQFIAAKLFHGHFPAPLTLDPHNDPQWQVLFTSLAFVLGVLAATLLTLFWERPFLNKEFHLFSKTRIQ